MKKKITKARGVVLNEIIIKRMRWETTFEEWSSDDLKDIIRYIYQLKVEFCPWNMRVIQKCTQTLLNRKEDIYDIV